MLCDKCGDLRVYRRTIGCLGLAVVRVSREHIAKHCTRLALRSIALKTYIADRSNTGVLSKPLGYDEKRPRLPVLSCPFFLTKFNFGKLCTKHGYKNDVCMHIVRVLLG